MHHRTLVLLGSAIAFIGGIVQPATAQADPPAGVLFENVRIFDGTSQSLSASSSVLVMGNRIERIASEPIVPPPGSEIERVEGGGRTLMPGLIDAHVHTMMSDVPLGVLMTADPNYVALVAGRAATATLMRGFTSVRDMGGPSFGLKRAIDQGVLQAVREQLMQGASQIKLMAGGGVSSDYDPLDVTQFTEDEMRAAVEAAADWNTYVAVHAYTPKAIQQAIHAGVRCIDHAQLADEETARLSAQAGAWWSMQPFLDDEDATPFPPDSANRKKQLEMTSGTDTAYRLAKKYGVKLAWGTDSLFDPALGTRQGKQLVKMQRWFTAAQALRMATHDNAELLALSGPRSPYPGRLGVIEEGALADLLLVDGNPLENLALVATPETSFLVIMKDGRVFKNLTSR